jgi:glycerophosphoryl diester phosphodiesterase
MHARAAAGTTTALLGAAALVLPLSPAHAAVGDDQPLVVAHRGASAYAPENTLAAVDEAAELGISWVENDVQRTKDGELVVLHDPVLDRVSDRTGAVADLPWREVAAARIAGTEPVPRLADVLGAWPDVRLIVDPKSDRAVDPLVEVLRGTAAVDRVCVGSFSTRRLARVRAALGPRLATSMGPSEVRRLRLAAWRLLPRRAVPRGDGRRLGPVCVQVPVRSERARIPLAEPGLIGTAPALGLPVHVWTINDRAEMGRLLDAGVDGLISDDLLTLAEVLRERGAWPTR